MRPAAITNYSPMESSIAGTNRRRRWNRSQLPKYVSIGNACVCVMFGGNSIRSTVLARTGSTWDQTCSNCPDSEPVARCPCRFCDSPPNTCRFVLPLQIRKVGISSEIFHSTGEGRAWSHLRNSAIDILFERWRVLVGCSFMSFRHHRFTWM